MKRIYKTVLLALALKTGMAQTAFWTPTSYKGAFACTGNMWTDGWCEWDPQNANYPAPTMTVSANITSNTTWASGQTVLLDGQIYVTNNAVLTIQPGVVVRGNSNAAGASLIITKGARLMAAGTATAPIVFTSDKPAGSRGVGDWGGIILLGKASNNLPGGVGNIEGLPVGPNTEHGVASSPDDNDNSGTLTYIREEFSGYAFQVNKEINGITMGSVGRGTTMHHIQVSFNNDDAFEWFGGTVDAKYLVSYRNLDDDFDCDNGFRGKVQFGLIVRDPAIADDPAVSTSEGFECDNDAGGTTNTPKTAAIFSNITAIGPFRGNSTQIIASGYRRAARLRRNCEMQIFNSVFTDFQRGLHIDGTACENNASNGLLKFKHNIIAQTSGVTPRIVEINAASTFTIASWFGANMNDSLTTPAGLLVTPYNYTSPDYRPVCSNTLINSGANFTDASFVAGGVLSVNNITPADLKEMILYPNPTNGNTNLVLHTEIGFEINVSISNVTGQIVSTPYSDYNLTQGTNLLEINLSEMANGVYFVNVQSKDKREVIKLIVNN